MPSTLVYPPKQDPACGLVVGSVEAGRGDGASGGRTVGLVVVTGGVVVAAEELLGTEVGGGVVTAAGAGVPAGVSLQPASVATSANAPADLASLLADK